MSRGVYTVAFDQQTIAAASGDYDLFQLTAATDKPVEIVAMEIANKSEVTDTQEEMVAYGVVRGNATTASGGTSTTPRALDPLDGAASFSALTANSVPASAGTALSLVLSTFNIRAGLQVIYPDAMRPKTTAGAGLLCVRLLTALVDDATMSGTLWVREL